MESIPIIGCGMPRTGTKSLSKLLSGCKKVKVAHQLGEPLPFNFDRMKLRKKIELIKAQKGEIVGDVAHYYLNYIEELIKIHKVKVIVMKRDKQKTMKSSKALDWNPYIQKNVKGSEAFPYHCKNVDTATGFYFDEYYELIRRLKNRFISKILVIDVESLNTKEGITKIFDFCNIPEKDRKYKIGIRENKHFGL